MFTCADRCIVYWVGPILGALVAAGFYKFIKMLEYETANPDQDAAETTARKQAEVIKETATTSDLSPTSTSPGTHSDAARTIDAPAALHVANGGVDTGAPETTEKPWSTATDMNDQTRRLGRGASYMA